MNVVGVHGIGRARRKPAQVSVRWWTALNRGLASATDDVPPMVDFRLAWYGGLFLSPDGVWGLKGPLDTGAAPLDPDEADFLTEVAEEHAAADGVSLSDATGEWKGSVPAVLRPLVGVLARRADFDCVIGMVPVLRQVWRYLHDDILAARIRATVAQTMDADCTVLVAHSLGSVVAYETLALTGPRGAVWPGRLVTLGSPLGLQAVRKRLRASPAQPAAGWINLYDPADPVVTAQGLADDYPSATDLEVRNGSVNPHDVRRYLAQPETGAALLEGARQAARSSQLGAQPVPASQPALGAPRAQPARGRASVPRRQPVPRLLPALGDLR